MGQNQETSDEYGDESLWILTFMRRSNYSCLEMVLKGTTQRIISGEYERGRRLPTEPQLQAEWGVSRSVVREAMKILESQGLVRVEQGRGTFVNEADLTPLRQQIEWALVRSLPEIAGQSADEKAASQPPLDQWDALLDVRTILEIAGAERAARYADATELAAMQGAIAAMRGRPDDARACSDADFEFHSALASATRNPLWPALLGSLNDLLRRYFEIGHHGASNALMTANQHQAILDAVRAGDETGAAAAMREHLKTSEQDLLIARRKRRIPNRKAAPRAKKSAKPANPESSN